MLGDKDDFSLGAIILSFPAVPRNTARITCVHQLPAGTPRLRLHLLQRGCSLPGRWGCRVLLWPPLHGRPTLPQRMPSPTGTLRCWSGTSPQPGGVKLTKALDLFFSYYGQYIKGIYLRKCLSCQSFPMSSILNTPCNYWYYPGKYSPWSFLHWEPWLYLSASPHYNYHQAIFIAILLLFMVLYALQKSIWHMLKLQHQRQISAGPSPPVVHLFLQHLHWSVLAPQPGVLARGICRPC